MRADVIALNNVLQRLGYKSRPLRIEAAVFPDDRKFYGSILGSWREPGPRRAAAPDMWRGHLAVAREMGARHERPIRSQKRDARKLGLH
jgi:hypothetical protein